ncbi:MAG: aminoacyl-tRNA hydrolase [Bacilli bacterium]
MKLVLGIGNFGDLYLDTRHNSGFQAVDLLADDFNITIGKNQFDSFVGKGKAFDEDILLMKPNTYVNLSGNALIQAVNFYKIAVEDIIVIVDDMDLEPGYLKLKLKGSAGGHNGLKSIISVLGTEDFKRVRIGIGRPTYSAPDFVLSAPKDPDVYKAWKDGISKAAEAVEYSLKNSFEKAMNIYNAYKPLAK